MTLLALDQRCDDVEIERIADRLVRVCQQARGFRRAPVVAARADADHRETAARAANLGRVDRFGRKRDGDGGIGGLALFDQQRAVRSCRGKRRAFGHAVATDLCEDDVRGIGKARCFLL